MIPGSGPGGRWFESTRPDHQIHCRLLVDLGGFELAPVVDRTQVILRSQRMHRSHKNGALGCKRRASRCPSPPLFAILAPSCDSCHGRMSCRTVSGLKTMVAAQIPRTQVTNVSDRSGKCSRMLADFTFLNPTKFLERFWPDRRTGLFWHS